MMDERSELREFLVGSLKRIAALPITCISM